MIELTGIPSLQGETCMMVLGLLSDCECCKVLRRFSHLSLPRLHCISSSAMHAGQLHRPRTIRSGVPAPHQPLAPPATATRAVPRYIKHRLSRRAEQHVASQPLHSLRQPYSAALPPATVLHSDGAARTGLDDKCYLSLIHISEPTRPY